MADRLLLEFSPRRGIGPVAIGFPPPLDTLLGTPEPVRKLPVFKGTTWRYPAGDLQVECGPSGDVLEVTAWWEPASVAMGNVSLLGRPLAVVVEDLERLGFTLETRGHVEAESQMLGMRHFAEDGLVVSCTAFDPSRPLPLPSRNDILASLGLDPID